MDRARGDGVQEELHPLARRRRHPRLHAHGAAVRRQEGLRPGAALLAARDRARAGEPGPPLSRGRHGDRPRAVRHGGELPRGGAAARGGRHDARLRVPARARDVPGAGLHGVDQVVRDGPREGEPPDHVDEPGRALRERGAVRGRVPLLQEGDGDRPGLHARQRAHADPEGPVVAAPDRVVRRPRREGPAARQRGQAEEGQGRRRRGTGRGARGHGRRRGVGRGRRGLGGHGG